MGSGTQGQDQRFASVLTVILRFFGDARSPAARPTIAPLPVQILVPARRRQARPPTRRRLGRQATVFAPHLFAQEVPSACSQTVRGCALGRA